MSSMEKLCPDPEALAGWLEGSLSPERRQQLLAHLASCDGCRRAVAIASTLEGAPAPLAVDPRLVSKLVSASRKRRWLPFAAAAAAVLLVGLLIPRSGPSTPTVAEPVAVARPVLEVPVPPPVVVAPPEPHKLPAPDPVTPPPPPPAPAKAPEDKPAPLPEAKAIVKAPEPTPPPALAPAPVPPAPEAAPIVPDPALESVFVVEPAGDLWLRRERGEAKVGILEKAQWRDLFAARSAAASFSLESRASVVLEKGSEAAFSRLKTDDSYALVLGQGLVMLDTEGSSQKWHIAFGKSQLDFSGLNGRLSVESRDDRISAMLLEGKAELKIGGLAKRAEVGRELVLSREGGVVEQKGETQKKLARLDELRPKLFTAFAASFDERKEDFQPYPYAVTAGRIVPGTTGFFLQPEPPGSSKPGEKATLSLALRPERSFPVSSTMVLRFRYRTNLPSFSVKIGKYSADYSSRGRAGQWTDGEMALRDFSFEGTPLLPSDPVDELRFSAVLERKSGQLDVDGVQFVRRIR